jgi:cyclase
MNRLTSLITIIALALPLSGFGAIPSGQLYNYQARQNKPPLEIVKIGNGLYMAKGEWGSNIGFYIANNEVLVIDSKATKGATKKVIEEIAKVTKNPITRVVYTHSDPDSFNGREAYPNGAAIICNPKLWSDYWNNPTVYLEMNAPAEIYFFPKVDFIPAITFEGLLNIRIGRDEVTFLHYGPAHTSGDSVVWFKSDHLAFIGDLVFPGREPLIQDQKGGYSFGLVRVLGILLELKPDIQTFVPSHADPVGRDVIEQTLRSVKQLQSKVTAMFDSGKSLEDVKKAFGVREPPQEPGAWVWPSLAVTVYRELKESSLGKKRG